MKLKPISCAVFASWLVLSSAGVALAQQSGGTAGSPPATTSSSDKDHGSSGSWGWIGLLGLAGLAGLAGRKRGAVTTDTTTTRRI